MPAGAVGPEYVRRLATLSSCDVLTRPDDAWTLFERELCEQLAPDVMLFDARTGLGDWGGLTLLRLADEAFLIVYPSNQNLEGLRFIRDMLAKLGGRIKTHLALSPVPDAAIGRELVAKFTPNLGLQEDEEPVVEVLYNPGVAAAQDLPVESAKAGYARLSNIVQDTGTEDRLEATPRCSWSQVSSRRKILNRML